MSADLIPEDYRLVDDSGVEARARLGEKFTCAFCGRGLLIGPIYFGCSECGILDATLVLDESKEFAVPDSELSDSSLQLRACIVAEAEGMIDP